MGMALGNNGGGDEAEYRPISEINITPMVDVMLVLLIIFMVTAPLLVAGVPVELPSTSAAKVSQPKKPMIVSLAGDGSIYVREEQVTLQRLGELLPRRVLGELKLLVQLGQHGLHGLRAEDD